MGNRKLVNREGTVIGYLTRFIPAKTLKPAENVTRPVKAKMAAFVHVQPKEGRTYYTVPSRAAEMVYDEHRLREMGINTAEDLTPAQLAAHRRTVLKTLLELHPDSSTRKFTEEVKMVQSDKPGKTKKIRHYELNE